MSLKSICVASLLAVAAVAKVAPGGRAGICNARSPTAEQVALARTWYQEDVELRGAGLSARNETSGSNITIQTYFHMLAMDETVEGGYLTKAMVDAQLNVINERFNPYGIAFVKAGEDWTVNTAWARDEDEAGMKRALRNGSYADLNLYFVPTIDFLGYCYLPVATTDGDAATRSIHLLDGCTLQTASVPGGAAAEYNLGLTAVHEIGHWLNLFHTFEGGCAAAAGGDRIGDTPAEAAESTGCPVGRNSCPDAEGVDPIHNYMDYSSDECATEFSPGQVARMVKSWDEYRAPFQREGERREEAVKEQAATARPPPAPGCRRKSWWELVVSGRWRC